MDKATKLRWILWLSALCATIIAIDHPVTETAVPIVPTWVAQTLHDDVSKPVPIAPNNRRAWVASDENPFGSRTWTAAPSVAEPVPAVPAPAPPPVQAVEIQVPPLPYRFLGRMQDGDERLIYLGRGEQVVLARQGDLLDGTYKVVSVDDKQLEFESVQSGLRQTLPIPAQ